MTLFILNIYTCILIYQLFSFNALVQNVIPKCFMLLIYACLIFVVIYDMHLRFQEVVKKESQK